jgi:hypothetical protein
MHPIRVASRLAACCGVVVLAGCAKKEAAVDTAAIAPPATATSSGAVAPAPAAPVALADFNGTWKVRSVPTSGSDTSATELTLTANGDKWSQTYANGLKVPVKVSLSGDSVITDAGPYASVRRKGVQVITHGSFRKEGDKLVGTTTAHYKTKGADSVLVLHSEGTKAP